MNILLHLTEGVLRLDNVLVWLTTDTASQPSEANLIDTLSISEKNPENPVIHPDWFQIFPDFPVVTVGPDNPYRVELDHTAEMMCHVDAKPATESVRWEYAGRFIDTNYRHIIPQVKCLAFSHFNVPGVPEKMSLYVLNCLLVNGHFFLGHPVESNTL